MRQEIECHGITYQLTPAGNHCRHAAERAFQTFKKPFHIRPIFGTPIISLEPMEQAPPSGDPSIFSAHHYSTPDYMIMLNFMESATTPPNQLPLQSYELSPTTSPLNVDPGHHMPQKVFILARSSITTDALGSGIQKHSQNESRKP